MTVASSDEFSPALIRLAAILLLLVVTVLSFSIPHRELYWEEGRRVMAAREMLSSNDYVIPTVSGQPYLNKPPLYPWLTAMVGALRGEVDAIAVRIPTLIATILTAAYLVWTGIRLGAGRVGFLAAFFFLLCPMIIRKSSLGETDLLLTFGCSVYALEMLASSHQIHFRPRIGSVIRMVGGLLIAFLAKGTAAIPLVAAVMVATAVGGEHGRWRRTGWWAPPLVALGITSLWIVAVLQRPDSAEAIQRWSEEMTRAGSSSEWWRHRWEYIMGVLLGFFPATLVLFYWVSNKVSAERSMDRSLRWLMVVIVMPAFIYLLWPGVQPRYLLPVLPLLCWLVAKISWVEFDKYQTEHLGILVVSRILRTLIAILGVAVVVITSFFDMASDQLSSIPEMKFNSWIWVAVLAFLGAFFPTLLIEKIFPGKAWSRIFLVLLAWAAIHSLIWMPFRGQDRPGETIAREIESHVPEGSTLWHDLPANWNTLAQVRRSILVVGEPEDTSSGDWILTTHPDPTTIVEVIAEITLLDGSRAKLGVVSSQLPKEK